MPPAYRDVKRRRHPGLTNVAECRYKPGYFVDQADDDGGDLWLHDELGQALRYLGEKDRPAYTFLAEGFGNWGDADPYRRKQV